MTELVHFYPCSLHVAAQFEYICSSVSELNKKESWSVLTLKKTVLSMSKLNSTHMSFMSDCVRLALDSCPCEQGG